MDDLILSEEDLYLLDKYCIYLDKSNDYFRILIDGKYQYLHRFITGAKKGEVVDHKDRIKHNNKRDNLRKVSVSLNCYNREVKNNLGRGIYFDKWGDRYRTCISYKNKTLKLGSFKNINDAKKAYNTKAIEIYGEDAFLHDINI